MTPPRSRSAASRAPAVAREGEIVVYTDGACLGNPGPGGWAWAIPGGPYASGAEPHTTNQRMEITAALKALEELKGPVLVISDSTYVVNCFRDRWYEGWKRRGWKNTAGKPVANRDLWEPLLEAALDPGRSVRFGWVKGHSGDTMNDRVDLLATTAAAAQIGRAGVGDGAGEHFPD
jgi:ribonuclease HI